MRCATGSALISATTKVLLKVRRSFFDNSCNLLRPGDVDQVTGASGFNRVAASSCGIPPFEIGVDGSVFCCYHHPARFASLCRYGDDRSEIAGEVEHLRSRHESGLLSRQVGREVLMELRGVKISEAISCLLYRSRLAEVTWEALSVVSLILSSVWHVGCNVHQSGNRWIAARFSNYGSPIAVSDKNARSLL